MEAVEVKDFVEASKFKTRKSFGQLSPFSISSQSWLNLLVIQYKHENHFQYRSTSNTSGLNNT